MGRRDGWIAIAYFALYLTWQFFTLQSGIWPWVTLVALPLLIAWAALPPSERSWRRALASVGLSRDGFWAAIQQLVRRGEAVYLFPLGFVVALLFDGVTEEVFFRGFLQTRLGALTGRAWAAMLSWPRCSSARITCPTLSGARFLPSG